MWMHAVVLTLTLLSLLCHSARGQSAGCGEAAGCFRLPEGCAADACEQTLSWTPEGFNQTRTKRQAGAAPTYVDFQLSGISDGWVAFALSSDQQMADDSVMECVLDDVTGEVRVFMSYNTRYSNENNKITAGLSDTSGSYTNGRITCSFRRQTEVPDEEKVLTLDAEYYLFLARGSAGPDAVKRQHSPTGRTISGEMIRLTEGGAFSGSAGSLDLYKAHALCMLAAWMVTAYLGMLMPRFFKDAWPDRELCKTKVWFSLHRLLMVLTLLLTITGFVLIFVAVQDYSVLSGFQKAHPVMGIVVTFFVILNPLMALCRPHPGTPRRPIFNWAHWFVGRAALILGGITVYFGFYIPTAESFATQTSFYILIALSVFHGVIAIGLEIRLCVVRKRASNRGYDMEMKEGNRGAATDGATADAKDLKILYVIFAIYVLGTLGCFIAMAVLMGMA